MELKTKSMSVAGFKVLDDAQGIAECWVSGIGNRDSQKDIIQSGAFDASLEKRNPKGVWSHNWDLPVAKTLDAFEMKAGDDRLPEKMKAAGIGGLYVKAQYNLKTERGRDAFADVKFFGEDGEYSIGYREVETSYDKKSDSNLLHVVDLYEWSPVLFGANPLTATASVKAALRTADDGESLVLSGVAGKAAEAFVGALKERLRPEHKDLSITVDDEVDEKGDVDWDTFFDFGDDDAVDSTVEAKIDEADDEKGEKGWAAAGSYEAVQETLYEALDAAFPAAWVYIEATFDDHFVAFIEQPILIEGRYTYSCDYYDFPYTIGADGASLGTGTEVDRVVAFAPTGVDDGDETIAVLSAMKNVVGAVKAPAESRQKAIERMMGAKVEPPTDEKSGRVLSQKNFDSLAAAHDAIGKVLESATTDETVSDEKVETVKVTGLVGEKASADEPHDYVDAEDERGCSVCGGDRDNELHDGKSETLDDEPEPEGEPAVDEPETVTLSETDAGLMELAAINAELDLDSV